MSTADFIKCLCIALKELNESIFWVRLVGRNGWVPPARLVQLEAEAIELKKLFGSMVRRTIAKRKSGARKLD
jgi:four helix bundle protein